MVGSSTGAVDGVWVGASVGAFVRSVGYAEGSSVDESVGAAEGAGFGSRLWVGDTEGCNETVGMELGTELFVSRRRPT